MTDEQLRYWAQIPKGVFELPTARRGRKLSSTPADYCDSSFAIYVFSKKVIDLFRADLEAVGDLFAVDTDRGHVFAFFFRCVRECVDVSASDMDLMEAPGLAPRPLFIRSVAVKPKAIGDNRILLSYPGPAIVIVSQSFMCEWQAARLTGAEFLACDVVDSQ